LNSDIDTGSVPGAAPSAEPVVRIDHLGKRFGEFTAVDDLCLELYPGEILALLGPNGAGKTTTIRMLMGILQPSSGTASVRGLDCFRRRAEVKRHVGYLPDEPTFYDYLRGGEILRFVGEMHGLHPREAERRATSLVERLRLEDALEEFAVNYSKGMKKKLALICALLHEPSILILDEPTDGLDPFATRTLHQLVREWAASGVAIFFSTHLLDQAERLCHRVGILSRSRLAALGPLDELRSRLSIGGSLEDVFFEVAGDPEAREPESGETAG
jgi:ABC-2 type transport system ATP-binding protein